MANAHARFYKGKKAKMKLVSFQVFCRDGFCIGGKYFCVLFLLKSG